MDRAWRRIGPAAAVLIGVGIAAAACSSGPPAATGVATITTVASSSPGSASTGPGSTGASSSTGASLSTGGGGNSSEAGFASPGSRSAGGATFVTPGGNPAQAEKFASCVRSHGVTDFPDPSSSGQIEFSGAGAGTPQFQQAVQKCRSLLPNGGAPSPQQQQAAIASALKFSQCMRSHGITDFPDPTVSGGGTRISIKISVRSGQSSDLVPTSPAFQAAQKACRAFMPGGAFGGGPAKTSGSATGSS